MISRAVANEFAKMRHLKVGVIAVLMVLGVLALSLFAVISSPEFDPETPQAWNALLAGMSLGIPLLSPLLLAVLASRQTDIEHQGNGWLLQSTAGVTPGGVCRAKLVALGLIVSVVTLGTSLIVLAFGKVLAGILPPVPLGHWVGFTLCMLVVNLAVLALHILLSAKVENQLVALGVGVLGCILAVFSQGLPAAAAHVTPWGYYALAQAAGYEGDAIQALPIAYPSIAVLAVVVGVTFAVLTVRFDRQEA
ncbi:MULTISPECIES: ABC transporter permease [unclassified Microbacterium]|uniref:ABC transporter permease n=1 Tax=unclassified Microbacterium TaxID=2609290 RepID=UPI000EA9D577|nr:MULTISPECIES: ABC transporter permease [unclassified Microbacterium]MBT2486191.1 ABC transporter permease [Microbacterium sp. ISL-108]RKN68915.1 ABC transporter permease [Microbacterium sp. CGR2]